TDSLRLQPAIRQLGSAFIAAGEQLCRANHDFGRGGTGSVATATTEIIDLSQLSPTWVASANMSSARVEGNSVLLPNGKVLAFGGSPQNETANTASLAADL